MTYANRNFKLFAIIIKWKFQKPHTATLKIINATGSGKVLRMGCMHMYVCAGLSKVLQMDKKNYSIKSL